MQENHACYATKILMSASACWPYGGEIGNLFGTCFFQSCKSFIQTDCTCPLEWLGWFDLHFWIPNFQTHSRKSLVLLFLSLFLLVKSPFFCCWNHGLQRPRLGNAAPGLPMFGIRQAASAQHQHRRRCRIRGETARGALRQKKRAPCRCGKSYGKLKQYWIVIYIYANKV